MGWLEVLKQELVKCLCGCGKTRLKYDDQGREYQYIKGHNATNLKGKNIKNTITIRAARHRARQVLNLMGITECQTKNKHCLGKLDSHHIDGNEFNNERKNLLLLCRTHHRLAHTKNLNLEQLRNYNAPFYLGKNNRKRYR